MTRSSTWSQESSPRPAPRSSWGHRPPVGLEPRRGTPSGNGPLDLQGTAGNAAVARLLGPGNGAMAEERRGELLDPGIRAVMEARFGADFSAVRVHADPDAAKATRQDGSTAVTLGRHVFLGADAPALGSDAGRRLLAHELAHVVQQRAGGNGSADVAGHAEREADAAASAVTAGRVFPVLCRTGPMLARQAPGGPPPVSPLTLPSEGVDMPWVGKGAANSSELGYLRDPAYFWSHFEAAHGNQLSPANRSLIADGRAPVVDPTWVRYHPQHAAYLGDTLEHHHVGQGSRAVPIPEKLHDAYTVFHPQRRVVGTPDRGTRPLPPQPTRQETQAEINRHVQQGRIRGPGITRDNPPAAPSVPVSSEVAALPTAKPPAPAKPPAAAVPAAPAKTASRESTSKKSTPGKSTTPTAERDRPAPKGGKGGFSTGTALVKTTAEGATAAMMGKALSELNQLAARNPGDKDLGAAVNALNDTLDAKSFLENPTGFLAGKGKDAIIQGVFNHFAELLDATRRSFVRRFPDVASLHQDPVHNGVSLEDYRQDYRKRLEALRIPAARHAIFYVAALLGLPADAPAEEVERRIALANRELARFPGTASYVARFHEAQDRYSFALAAVTNDLNLRGDALDALPRGLVEDLRRRADALHHIGSILDHMQQDLWNNGLVVWAPILAVQQDLESLAQGFTGLGSSMSDLADVVGGRRREYGRELDRLATEARDVAARSTRAFTVPDRDETKR